MRKRKREKKREKERQRNRNRQKQYAQRMKEVSRAGKEWNGWKEGR